MSWYLDAAATTPLSDVAWAAMEAVRGTFGNPSSLHGIGQKAAMHQQKCLAVIAAKIGCKASQLVVTHGGTDANRKVISAVVKRFGGASVFASNVEHSSIADEVLPGNIYDAFTGAGLRGTAKLVCQMHGNNETGIILSAEVRGKKASNALVLRDWVQSLGKVKIDLQDTDFATFSAHKINGPKGVGVLYCKHPAEWPELMQDTHTKDPIATAGMAAAFASLSDAKIDHLRTMQHALEALIESKIERVKIIHQSENRVAGISSIAFAGVRGSALMRLLNDHEGICVSTGSACNQDLLTPTSVIQAVENDPKWQYPIRIGLHQELHNWNAQSFVEVLAHYVAQLRKSA